MKRFGGVFGLILVVIAAAIILWLVGESTRQLAPSLESTSLQMEDDGLSSNDDGADGGEHPNLEQMQAATTAHAQRVQDALENTD